MISHWKTILCVSILVLAGFIFLLTRSAELLSGNFVFVLDQGRDFVAITDITSGKKFTLIGSEIGGGYAGINGIFQGPLHYYILSFFSLIFRGDPYSGIVYMFLFSLLALIVSFIAGKKIFKNTLLASVIALLVALSPPLISQAKYSWNPHPMSLCMALLFLFLFISIQKSKKYLFLSGFVTALTYNFEIASTVPMGLALLIFYIFFVKLRKVKEYVALLGGLVLGMAPFILFEVRHNFMAFNGFLRYILSPDKDAKNGYFLLNNHFDRFLYNFGDTFSYQTLIPVLPFFIIFAGLFIYFLTKEKNKEIKLFLYFLVLQIISTIFVLSFLRNHIFMYYLYQLNFGYIFMFGYLVYAAYTQKKKYILYFLAGFLLLLSILSITHGVKDFKNDYFDYGGISKIQGKKDAVDYIYKDANGKPFGLFIFTPGVFTYPYDYAFSWYGAKKYGYVPNQSKDDLFYLLIEEDKYNEWAVKGWMDTIIKEGEVIDTKKLKSGFIVQKRNGR